MASLGCAKGGDRPSEALILETNNEIAEVCQMSRPPWKFAACLLFPDAGLFRPRNRVRSLHDIRPICLRITSAFVRLERLVSQLCNSSTAAAPRPKPCQPLPDCALEEPPLHLERPAAIAAEGTLRKGCGCRVFLLHKPCCCILVSMSLLTQPAQLLAGHTRTVSWYPALTGQP